MSVFRRWLALSILLALMGGLYGCLTAAGGSAACSRATTEKQIVAPGLPVAATDKPGYTADSLATVRRRLASGQAVLVDVREQDEWDAGHLRAAVLVPLSQLSRAAASESPARRLAQMLPAGKTIYGHCASGRRALLAAGILQAMGNDFRPLKDGYTALVEAGFETATP